MLILKKKPTKNGYVEKYLNTGLVLVLVVLPVLFYFLFFRSTYGTITSAKREAKQYKIDIDDLNGRLITVEGYNKEFKKVAEEDLKKIAESLPNKIDTPNLFVNLEALGLNNDLKLTAINVQEDESNKKRAAQAIVSTSETGETGATTAQSAGSATVSSSMSTLKKAIVNLSYTGGGYNSLKNLVAGIEKNLRLMRINYLSFNPGDNTVNIILETYYVGI